ncbi:DUF2235 domain-containing protein [Chryseobacterium culicis]|jgi:hypothetical protein|uniref:Uncharacterized alpha/beta hydrolase domain n=1 Tax=Chryseobacterium culicis TaxID=680127 RepID=A0A1H6H4S0_CHRCI|nr:DUF2235 domain-containing protein [Chryseobacterium culicis]MBE4947778.1 DUF2235 domain-containing protein [Chryseobacterium culicis]SEH29138.1 Uncharacterized alpha/beta hydrolase domain [Chryseobacterium culicis]
MSNVVFGNYSPSSAPENIISVALGIFFDGTLNNKTNSDARKNKTKAYDDHGGDPSDNNSYNNDWSNVARLWENYDKRNAIYIEGIGTQDNKGDEMDGYAYGSEKTGIKAKVQIGCEKIAEKISLLKKANSTAKLGTVTLDVFGFSRGAAAARYFVHQVSKKKVSSDPKSIMFGNLGTELKKVGVNLDEINVIIRFLGIFDTVSSYSENTWTTSPNFSNDIEELQLDDIARARKIVHFTAENEHRINFDLTDIKVKVKQKTVYLGIEKSFPGVHSDIGGGYETGPEAKDEIINGSTSVQKKRKEQLVAEGWFQDGELIIHEYRRKLSSNRKLVKKTYSFIPLQFMGEYGKNDGLKIDTGQISTKYKISDDPLLVRVKNKLTPYVMGNGKPYTFRWTQSIHDQYKGSKVPEQRYADYQRELAEQTDLRELRNKYLHWSADYDWVGMDPREDGKRVVH